MDFSALFKVISVLSCAWISSASGSSFYGSCSQCLANGIACLDEHTFALCLDGRITAKEVTCPPGLYCSDQKQICVPLDGGTEPICRENYCGGCVQGGRFACLNETSYGLCYGRTQFAGNAVHQCPVGYVCNVRVLQVCSSEETTFPSCVPTFDGGSTATGTIDGISTTDAILPHDDVQKTTAEDGGGKNPTQATTATVNQSTGSEDDDGTTTSTSDIDQKTTAEAAKGTDNPDTFCGRRNATGYFKDESDRTCKRFIHCYLLGGQYLGMTYKCAQNKYYNAAAAGCQEERPSDCLA